MLLAVLLFTGCLASPVAKSGGPGSVTIKNTSTPAIHAAAREVLAAYGYRPAASGAFDTIAFERPAGATGRLFFGSYGQTTSMRLNLQVIPLPNNGDFRVIPRVSRVNNAGLAGFEDETKMLRVWSGQFSRILREIQKQAENSNG